jgi:hypothetical protein
LRRRSSSVIGPRPDESPREDDPPADEPLDDEPLEEDEPPGDEPLRAGALWLELPEPLAPDDRLPREPSLWPGLPPADWLPLGTRDGLSQTLPEPEPDSGRVPAPDGWLREPLEDDDPLEDLADEDPRPSPSEEMPSLSRKSWTWRSASSCEMW